ncbi:transcription factor TFIIIB component B'' homolog [Perognathus longimembris pacificus]|uniref:transcription factor TFIIIB component B'' homolog n=1 Tax=Perognathus longimembris pacificus TaxID=214514 RepID=UPI002019B575|nr:transcription factor TFIIIB component B'' homolog [Perognathus longimembris pacificus]
MFRRARLSVKPNVRPGVGARGSAAPQPQRGRESPRPPQPAAESAPGPAPEPPASEPQEKAPGSRDEKISGEHKVEESTNVSTTVSQRRKRVSSTCSLVKPSVSVPSQSHPLSTVNQDTSQPNPIPAREKQPCSDRYRIYKAQKLREMLKEELRKEKKQWKNKYGINESQKIADRSKMTMRDFIYYLPDKNPMASSLEQEKKTEKSLTSVQTREQENKGPLDADEHEEAEEEIDDGPLLVPRVKVAEDGSIILDEESLTVEVLRTKGPCVVEENDPIFERGSTTTYSSFRKNCYSKPWSNKETDMFFLAISMVGTDFSMIGQLFPHRARIEIKNKFKREEKTNGWRIDKAFQEKRPFDFDFFAHLLQKVLAEEEKRKQKSVKNQSLKEKSSKPRKNVKVKKVTSKGVNDDPDESVSTKISDTERSLKDAQTVEEEESLISSGQDSEQVVLEQDQNQKKRKRKNQDEANEQEVENLLGNVTVHSSPPESEVHNSNSEVLCAEAREDERSEPQVSCPENIDDIVGLVSNEKVEKRTEPILSSSSQPDTMPIAPKSSESSTSDLLPSEVVALCEVNNSENSCTEEKHEDLERKSVETDQAESVKPLLRVRHQRPKPNLSRAIGKKSGKTDAESKSSQSDNSVEKDSMEKEKMNVIDNSELESVRREDSEADTVSTLSEKTCLQEDNQPKTCKPVRPMRGRFQRPKPNVGKAAERKIIPSQEKIGVNIEKTRNESCVDRDITQTTDQTCKNFQCEDTTSEPEKNDTPFQNVQLDESKGLNKNLSIQEDNETNVLKQVSIQRTRFQKPKPNIGRRNGKREISSKGGVPEEGLASQELTPTLRETVKVDIDTSPTEKVPNAPANAKELDSDLKTTGRSDISPNESMPEMTNVSGEMETGLSGIERETSPKETGEVIDTILETEAILRSAGKEVSSKETIPELVDATEENDTNLEESGREIVPQEDGPNVDKPVAEVEICLKESGKEKTPEMIGTTNKRDLEETEGRGSSSLLKAQEETKTTDEMRMYLKETGGEPSQRVKVLMEAGVTGEREIDFRETGKEDISLVETVSGRLTAIEETEADFKDTGRDISEEVTVTKEVMADLEKAGNIGMSPKESAAEESGTSRQNQTTVSQSGGGDCNPMPSCDMENIRTEAASVMCMSTKEKENSEKEVPSHLNNLKTFSQSSGLCEADQVVRPTDNGEQLPTSNLSKSLPEEQKPVETKPAPVVRSRFKRPKPNLVRASLKRETTDSEKYVPEKKSEVDERETVVVEQDSEPPSVLSFQHDSLTTSREKDKSLHEEEAEIVSCSQTGKDPSPSNSCDTKEESQLTQTQENDLVIFMGTEKQTNFQQETKENVIQTVLPLRGRLQRPKPNVQKARKRQIMAKGEAEDKTKEEGTIAQKDERKKSLALSNAEIESEIEVVSSKVSECRMDENASHVVPAESHQVDKINILEEKMRCGENKPHVPNPAQLIRRFFQKPKPNLGRANSKKGASMKKGTTDESKVCKPEDNLLQQGDSDTQLLVKEKTDILTSLEVSARKDFVGSEDCSLAQKHAQLDVGPAKSVEEETGRDNSVSSIVDEQQLSKPTSHPQPLKRSSYSKINLDKKTTTSSTSECEIDHSGKRTHRKSKPNVTKGRGSKRIRGKTAKKEPRASKSMLVTLRASQEEDEDDAEDFEPDYEEETYHLAPEELNKAPVFVPVGLRSPEPVSAQIEETMEELEITENVADVGCLTVVEPQPPNMDVTALEARQGRDLYTSSFEMVSSEQARSITGSSDGSTEAAITLLTMGDIVLQSEISTEQGDVGVCIFHSEDGSHIPFSTDNVNHKPVDEYQELTSLVTSGSAASLEDKIVSEEQNIRDDAGLMEDIKETTPTRNTVSQVTSSLRMSSSFAEPKANFEKISDTSRFDAHQEVPNFCITKGEEEQNQRETEQNVPKATELEDKSFGPVTTANSTEQNQLTSVSDVRENSIPLEANLTKRNEEEEDRAEVAQVLSVTSVVSPETVPHTVGSSWGLCENSMEETLRKGSTGESMLTCHAPECAPPCIPEVQQENVTNPQDLAVNLFTNIPQDEDDEQTVILTLVEIPASEAQEFTGASVQLMPNPLLPAPILVKSGSAEGRSDLSLNLPVTSIVQDATCLSNCGRDDSEKPPANLDLISRKRFHCRYDESDYVPPAKKCSLPSEADCQEHTFEVCSKDSDVCREAGVSYKGKGIFSASGSTHTTQEPQKEQLEPTFQNTGSIPYDNIRDLCAERSMVQLPQDEMIVSDKEERTNTASKSEQIDKGALPSKAPLSRPGRRPLGFLSLICPKNSVEPDESTQLHSKKRLKPIIPISRRNLKRSSTLKEDHKKHQESSNVLTTVNTQSQNTGSLAAQVSSDQPSLKGECKSGQKRAPEDEPPTVSEYFFGDIFIEMDEIV